MGEDEKRAPNTRVAAGERRRSLTPAEFLRLCESLPLAVFETDPDDRCLYVNPRWTEITGQTTDPFDGHGWQDAIHPCDREWVLEEVQLARGQDRMFDADFRVQRTDGSVRWVHGRSLPLHQVDGTHDGFIHAIYDITDRKITENQLRGSLEDLKRQGKVQAEASQICPAEQARDRLEKSLDAAEAALEQLTRLAAEEVEDHSLDDVLF